VSPVSGEVADSNQLIPDGKQQVTRKKPHVIAVAFVQNILFNSWFITWMAISTTIHYAI
jgi:hypothetical protein